MSDPSYCDPAGSFTILAITVLCCGDMAEHFSCGSINSRGDDAHEARNPLLRVRSGGNEDLRGLDGAKIWRRTKTTSGIGIRAYQA